MREREKEGARVRGRESERDLLLPRSEVMQSYQKTDHSDPTDLQEREMSE